MPTYKFTYFPGRARGETPRLLFALADVKFENNTVTFADWQASESQKKGSYPTGSMPTLELDGEVYVDSMAINHFLAREFGLAGRNNLEQLKVEGCMGTIDDIFATVLPALLNPVTKLPADKEQSDRMLKIPAAIADKKLPYIVSQIEKSGGPFICGKYLSVADVYLSEMCITTEKTMPAMHAKFPDLLKLMAAVLANPRIKKFKSENGINFPL